MCVGHKTNTHHKVKYKSKYLEIMRISKHEFLLLRRSMCFKMMILLYFVLRGNYGYNIESKFNMSGRELDGDFTGCLTG